MPSARATWTAAKAKILKDLGTAAPDSPGTAKKVFKKDLGPTINLVEKACAGFKTVADKCAREPDPKVLEKSADKLRAQAQLINKNDKIVLAILKSYRTSVLQTCRDLKVASCWPKGNLEQKIRSAYVASYDRAVAQLASTMRNLNDPALNKAMVEIKRQRLR